MKKIKGIFIGIGKNKHANASCSGITCNVKEKDLPKLHKAAWMGELSKVKKLTKKDPNAQDRHDKENRTALHLACAGGHSKVVQELLSCNAKIDSVDSMSKTPLMQAIECNHEECVEELLKYNPNLETKDLDHNTALHIAVKEGHANIVSHIIDAGADLNAKNKEEFTPLILSILDPTRREDITKLLLDKGADPNQVDKLQRSALHYACEKNSINHVKLLLARNASTTLKDFKDWTAEDVALIKEHHDCSQILYVHNIKHRKLLSGNTPASNTPRAAGSLTSSINLDSPRNISESFPGAGLGMPCMPLVDSGEDSDDQTVSKHSGSGDRQNSWADDTDLSSLTENKGVPVKTSLTKHLKIDSDEDGTSSETDEEADTAAPVSSGKPGILKYPVPDPNRRRSPAKFRKVLVSTGDVSGKVRPMYSRTPTPDADLHQSHTISPLPYKYNASSKIPAQQASLDHDEASRDAEIPLKNVFRVSFSEERQVISATDEDTDIEEDEDEEVEPIKKRRIETPEDSKLDGYSPVGWSKSSTNNLSREHFHDDIFDVSDPEPGENDESNIQDAGQDFLSGSQTTTPRGILKKNDVGKSPSVLSPADSSDDDSDWDSTKHSETDNLAKSAYVQPAVNSPEVNSDIGASLNPDNSQVDKTSQWDSTEETYRHRTPRDIHDSTNMQDDYLHEYDDTYQEDSYIHKETVTSFKVRQDVHPSVGAQTKSAIQAPHVSCMQTGPLDMMDSQYTTRNNVSVVNAVSCAGTRELARISKQLPQPLDSNEDSDWDSEKEISNPEVDESAVNGDDRDVAVASLENTPRTETESISEWELENLREAEENRQIEFKLLQELEEEEERQKQWEDEHSRRQAQVLLEAEEELRREQMSNDSDVSDFSEADGDLPNSARQQDFHLPNSARHQDLDLPNSARQHDLHHSHDSQPVLENLHRSHQSDNSIPFSLTSHRMHELKKLPPKLVVTQFLTQSASIRNETSVKVGEIENESPALDDNNHHREQQDNNNTTTNVSSGRLTCQGSYQHEQGKMIEHKDLIDFDDDSDDEVAENIYDDNEQVEEINIYTISRQEASVQQSINTDYNGVRYELESQLLGTPPPIPTIAHTEKVLSQLSDRTSIGEYDAPPSHSFKIPQVTSISHLPEISGATGLHLSGLEVTFEDDGLSVTSTENSDITNSYRTEQLLPYGKDMLVNMNLSDSGAILKLQEHLGEQRKQLEHERSQRRLVESKNKRMVKEREEMQKAINSLKSEKTVLDQLRLDHEAKIRNFEYSVSDEVEKKKNAESLLKKTKEQLSKKEEQYTQEMEARQRTELTLRNIHLELQSTHNQLKELEDEKAELERLLANERNARHLHEKINDEQQRLQQHMKEEYMKTSSLGEDDNDALEVADDDIQHAHHLVGKYRHEITALKAEIHNQRTRLSEEIMIVSMENERLRQQVENLQSDVNQHQNAIDTAAVQHTLHKDQLVSGSTMLTNNLDKERVARENLESELETYCTRLQSLSVQLEKMQQARNDLERHLYTDREDWTRQLERKEKELLSQQEKLSTIMHSLNAAETKLNSVENELQISNRTALERSNQYQQVQRELQLYKSTHEDLESNFRHEKEQNIKLTTKLESLQDRLTILQHENLSIKQHADLAQHMASERSGYDLQDKLNTMIAALKADHDKARALLEDKNTNLQGTISHLREEVRNSDNRRSNLELDIRSLNQELNNLIKKLSVSEASLDVCTKARERLEQEKLALKMELENLQQKYYMAQEKTIENQSRMSELVGRLDGMEESQMLTKRQLAEKSATMQVFNSSKEDLEKNYQKLQKENVQLEAELHSVKQKIDVLQRDLVDSQKVRNSLDALCSSLKSTNVHLEGKLGGEVSQRNLILKDMEDHKELWEQEVILRSKLGMRMAQLDRQKQEAVTQLEEEKRKSRKAMELKKYAETKLEAEQDKCSNLQKEVVNLKAYLRVAKQRLKNSMDAGYTEKTSHEGTKKEIEKRYRLDLNRKLDEVNNYLEEQARSRQRLDLNRDEQETKLRTDKKKLEEELSNLQIKYEQALAKLKTKELEAKRYHELYSSEMQWRMRLSDQLYKSTDLAFEVKNIMERPKTRMFGSLSNLSMNCPPTDYSKTSGSLADHALSNRLKSELDRSIAKHLEAGPHVSNEDSFVTTTQFTRASAKYHDVLKRKFCV